jgi:hypothetical protein
MAAAEHSAALLVAFPVAALHGSLVCSLFHRILYCLLSLADAECHFRPLRLPAWALLQLLQILHAQGAQHLSHCISSDSHRMHASLGAYSTALVHT